MEFLIKNDFNYIKKKLPFFLIFYFIWFMLAIYNSFYIYDDIKITSILGIRTRLDIAFIYIILYMFNILVFIFMSLLLYTKDLRSKYDYIFMRIKPQNWFISKLFSITFIILVFKIILYLILLICNSSVFEYFIIDIIITLITTNLVILLFNFIRNKQVYFIILICLIGIKIRYDLLILNTNVIILLAILSFLIIINMLTIKQKIYDQFERSNL